MKIICFPAGIDPDYVFASDDQDTVLTWPETAPNGAPAVRFRELREGGEIDDYRVYGYDVPADEAAYTEIMEAVRGTSEWEPA